MEFRHDHGGPVGMKPPRYPLEGVLSWNMNTTCNYRCSYCTQRFVDDRSRWAADVPRFLEAFAQLPGDWEIKLSGGEPFRHPAFLDVVAGLVEQGRRVSVVTNFSAKDAVLESYADLVRPRPGLVSRHAQSTTDKPSLSREVPACVLGPAVDQALLLRSRHPEVS